MGESFVDRSIVACGKESDIGDDKSFNVMVALCDECRAVHGQKTTERRGVGGNMKCRVADFQGFGMRSIGLSHHFGPGLQQPVLQQGSFKSHLAEKMPGDIGDGLRFSAFHNTFFGMFGERLFKAHPAIACKQPLLPVRNFRDVSMRDVEQPIVAECLLQDAVEVFAVGVSDENLPEVVATDIVYDACYASGIEFVEDVIKQEYWCLASSACFQI